jgi:polygalacturonase
MKLFSKHFVPIFVVIFFLLCTPSVFLRAQTKDIAYYMSKAPFKMEEIAIPKFAANTFSITDYGAVSDNKTLNTTAFAKAIDACTKIGGGKVIVPAGNWLTGPIELKSNVDLDLAKGALIQFTTDHTQYPMIFAGGSSNNITAESPLYAYNATNIAITGQGVIDGAGDSWRPIKKSKVPASVWGQVDGSGNGVISSDGKLWWPSFDAMNGESFLQKIKNKTDATPDDYLPARDYLRPYMLYLIHCDTILIQGVALRNSPKFVFYPNHCTNLTLDGVTLYNDWWAQNGDGMDISACKNVAIYKCLVNAGDDGICMKSSGGNKDSIPELQNIIIAGCTVMRAHGGFVIGSNTDGGMQNIYVADCKFIGTDIGIRVKSNPGRGGLVKNIYIDNIDMSSIQNEAILFTTYYEDVPAGKSSKNVNTSASDKIPEFTDFHISNIKCSKATTAISITGLPGSPVHNIYFNNLNITAGTGFVSTDAKDIFLDNVELNSSEPIYSTTRSKNILADGKSVE